MLEWLGSDHPRTTLIYIFGDKNMSERTLQCVSCDSEYTIEYDEDAVTGKDCYCPFCGHMHDFDDTEEDDSWNEEEE